MQVTVQMDSESRRALAVYFKLEQGRVHRTVEIARGECNVDEDRHGKLLGIEMLRPGTLELHVKTVARKYGVKGLTGQVRRAAKAITV